MLQKIYPQFLNYTPITDVEDPKKRFHSVLWPMPGLTRLLFDVS